MRVPHLARYKLLMAELEPAGFPSLELADMSTSASFGAVQMPVLHAAEFLNSRPHRVPLPFVPPHSCISIDVVG